MSVSFDLSTVFSTVAAAVPDQTFVVWRDRRLTYAQFDAHVDGFAHFLVSAGLGVHTERAALAGHESGQDHLGIYLRNGNEYLEAMIGSYRARVAPFNVSYRYVEEELLYLLTDSNARALVYNAEFAPRVAAIRDRLPNLAVLIQVADDSGNELLPGAVDYEAILGTPEPEGGMPVPSGDDLYILYTGGTTGMPKGVLWRQHDIFLSSMGGRPFGAENFLSSYEELADKARASAGAMSMLMIPPFMHGAAQWASYTAITMGGKLVIPDDVVRLRPDAALRLAERERVMSIPVVGDAIARPLIDEIEGGNYDLSGLVTISNGGAPLSPTVRSRILAALPHLLLLDAVGASESGAQMSAYTTSGAETQPATFTPQPDTAVVSEDLTRVLGPGEGGGWLARRDLIPLGYLGDAEKTARTFPTVDGVRWSVPGDRANVLPDGRIQLLGRDSVTINSGGEKIFVEEVERAIAAHPAVYDVVVVGRPSERWGSEVVAIVQFAEGASATDDELVEVCERSIARYKIPKAFIRSPEIVRSPAGKADYRWAKQIATEAVST
ncbi:acyl-CoA synthetase [Mycolicibacterium smegmatis]|uniref:Medium chain acyl-CoA synthetase n=3 Tax=Mycolicibacterium smegmatis TaxID=1772 RepID=A0QYK2_MYCS2|nr:acyl-CoA synthetase [Mycolicibacterium smegmatis]ABK75029.1 medium chain acyl-CoA synthetase [Mycolicibacterium smegmatis MC2 155]AFP40063.1 AMP-dependent synthetase and ligase [Mycolicibacterium smegmatis MC2 155]AIU08819.1 acyl-CoA synthetase [Mycolicibacterium smegmatis MC2 155]AIU15444.1 acyl-CoA synthetase [Mycolicibacterium smegmatis]AIU22067.1 acyl-CoA synthetase [Mycolicibacterium smegmatis]